MREVNHANLYPEPYSNTLRLAIAKHWGIPANVILTAPGACALIEWVLRALCREDDELIVHAPSFPPAMTLPRSWGVSVKECLTTLDLALDVKHMLAEIGPRTKAIFIANPNNPTGAYFRREHLERLISAAPPHVGIVVDEAYAEFADAPHFTSAMELGKHRNRATVIRTFSKAYGLAGLRVAYAVGAPPLLASIASMRPPFEVNRFAQAAAIAALQDHAQLRRVRNLVAEERSLLTARLQSTGVFVLPSQTNFLMLDVGARPRAVQQTLAQQGVVVKSIDNPPGLRVTLGTPDQNARFADALEPSLLARYDCPPELSIPVIVAAKAVTSGDPRAAALCTSLSDSSGDEPAARVGCFFGHALASRLCDDTGTSANLYERTAATQGEMLDAFSTLVEMTPLVTFGHRWANRELAATVTRAPHIIDVGCGTGVQMRQLIESLDSALVPRLKITAVDLPQPGPDPAAGLRQTGENLIRCARQRHIDLEFVPVAANAESFEPSCWLQDRQPVCVNAAFTLHHLQEPDRNMLLGRLLDIEPEILTLVEPDANHHQQALVARTREAFGHYLALYDVLESLLCDRPAARHTIENMFFGREIQNVIGQDDGARFERHERRAAWRQRLMTLGFRPKGPRHRNLNLAQWLARDSPHFSVIAEANSETLCWKETPLVCASVWGVGS